LERPTVPFALSLIGGTLVLLGGIGIFVILTAGFGIIREIFVIFGFIIIVGAIMTYTRPRFATAWGAAILLLDLRHN
jgi:hypothetical protein